MVRLSPKALFFATSLEEAVLVVVAVVATYYLAPQYLLIVVLLGILAMAAYLIAKYYIVYPVLKMGSGSTYELGGTVGRTVEVVTATSGKVKMGAEMWNARTESGEIPLGVRVVVVERKGMHLVVAAADGDTRAED